MARFDDDDTQFEHHDEDRILYHDHMHDDPRVITVPRFITTMILVGMVLAIMIWLFTIPPR